ncbi:heavy-metal-associated domain-containing protein [Flavobacterium sp.]|uniref:heavy-metal-associated domain-containing protein n=1 Tax=Flavobacterium sp. TaxID=239 RepID=UPI000ECEB9AD|nr:cation transporter [Flavobacterium sp.]HCQ13269.1 MerP protein [Flavobacterium sp.]
MNRQLIVLLSLFLSLATLAQNGKKNEKAVIKTNIYCDHCKECETCGLNFKDNMLKIKGVKMYELDAEKMTITVYYNGKKTNIENIKNSISKLGYDADEVVADATAYENLDGCCKKT